MTNQISATPFKKHKLPKDYKPVLAAVFQAGFEPWYGVSPAFVGFKDQKLISKAEVRPKLRQHYTKCYQPVWYFLTTKFLEAPKYKRVGDRYWIDGELLNENTYIPNLTAAHAAVSPEDKHAYFYDGFRYFQSEHFPICEIYRDENKSYFSFLSLAELRAIAGVEEILQQTFGIQK